MKRCINVDWGILILIKLNGYYTENDLNSLLSWFWCVFVQNGVGRPLRTEGICRSTRRPPERCTPPLGAPLSSATLPIAVVRSQITVWTSHLHLFLHIFYILYNNSVFVFVPPQALCLPTAGYLTAPAATSSSTRFTGEICLSQRSPQAFTHQVLTCDYNNYLLWEEESERSDLLQLE